MKRLAYHFLRSSAILSMVILSITGTVVLTPGHAQAFGSLSENGTAAFMGIGITPTKILHVSGTGPGTVPLFQRASDSAGFIIERTPTNRWVLGVNESESLGNGFVLSTIPTGNTSVARLIVKQTGWVGIGTTEPQSKLHVVNPAGAIKGSSNTGAGVHGQSVTSCGLYGESTSGEGVRGWSDSSNGVSGVSTSGYGVYGTSSNSYANSYAGYFDGKIKVTGSVTTGYIYTEDNYTVTDANSIIAVNAEDYPSGLYISLTTANGCTGRAHTIKKVDTSANDVIIDGVSTQTIDGNLTYRLYSRWDYVTIVSDGSNWLVVANN